MEERLQKVLARAGLASRRGAEKLIEDGRVSVNGRVVREMGLKVDPAIDAITVDTIAVPKVAAEGKGRRTYLLLNKPKGVLCTVKDDRRRQTVLDLVPPFQGKRLFPVGRLDEDSEGLVLLTNDGDLTQRLTHPSFGVGKTYDVRVKGKLTTEDAKKFEAGVWLSEGRTARSRIQVRRSGPKITHVAVTLTEGKNRELRRAFAKLGFPVMSIKRIQIGPIVSRGLKPGQFRPLDSDEVTALKELAETGAEGRVRPVRKRSSSEKRPRRSGKPDPAKVHTTKKKWQRNAGGRRNPMTSRNTEEQADPGQRSGRPAKGQAKRTGRKKPGGGSARGGSR